jgi:hypothetical protein
MNAQNMNAQNMNAQNMNAQNMNAQNMNAQAMNTQAMSTQGMSTQGMSTQGMSTQGMSTQGMSTQGMSTQGMSTQGMNAQGMSSEEMNYQSVQMTNNFCPPCNDYMDNIFYNTMVGASKLVNFRCTYQGKKYYLANMRTSDCGTYTSITSDVESINPNIDCATVKMVLIDADAADTEIQEYINNLRIKSEECKQTQKTKCITELGPNRSMEEENQCTFEYEKICNPIRKYITDFIITEIIQTNLNSESSEEIDYNGDTHFGKRKYIISGTAIPMIDDNQIETMLNNYMYFDHGVNYLCGDQYIGSEKYYTQIDVIERNLGNRGGIINASQPNIVVKLRMNVREVIAGIDRTTNTEKVIPIIDQDTGKPNIKSSYIGVCNSAIACQMNQRIYPRICLYDNINDPNVLEFEPILVNSNGGII